MLVLMLFRSSSFGLSQSLVQRLGLGSLNGHVLEHAVPSSPAPLRDGGQSRQFEHRQGARHRARLPKKCVGLWWAPAYFARRRRGLLTRPIDCARNDGEKDRVLIVERVITRSNCELSGGCPFGLSRER
jgi:hypothetical protein